MKFTPMTEDELARASLLEKGIYPFEVLSASDEISKSGNEMIKLKLNVFGNNGESVHIYDYLLEKLAYKLRHFAETAGLLAEYEAGTLEAQSCLDKAGFVKIGIDEGSNGYPPKNVAVDYLKPETPISKTGLLEALNPTAPKPTAKPAPAPAAAGGKPFDDDIPF